MKLLCIAIGALFVLIGSVAQADPPPSTALPSVHVLTPPLTISALGRERQLRVYLPPGYAETKQRFPVLYMHDAQNLFDQATAFAGEWGVDESMDALAQSDGIEVIVVGIDNGQDQRIHELTPWRNPRYGDAEGKVYLDFVVGTVKPFIDANYRTLPGRADTAIMGSSLGGLSAHYAIFEHSKVFSKAGIFSPSYWFSDEVFLFTQSHDLPAATRIYLAVGDHEGDEPARAVGDVRRIEKLIRASGRWDLELFTAIRRGAEHNEAFWRSEFPKAVRFLFPVKKARKR